MRKSIIVSMLCVLFMMVISTTVLASSLGIVVDHLEQGEFSATPEYTHVFDRDLNQESTEVDGYDQVYLNIAYGLTDNLKLYTKLGTSDMSIKGITPLNETTIEEYDFGFLWGGGIIANYRLDSDWIIGFAGEYTAWETDFKSVTVNGEPGIGLNGTLCNSEWQVTLYGGKEIILDEDKSLLPYIGIKYAELESDYESLSFSTLSTLYMGDGVVKNNTKLGVVVGSVLKLTENFSANIEGQFVDETGITLGITYKF